MSVKVTVRWVPTGKYGTWETSDPRFEGCQLRKKWLTSFVGPYVICSADENDTPGEGQMLYNGFGASILAATRNALDGFETLRASRAITRERMGMK